MLVGVGKNVCQTLLLFDGLFVHPFECNYSFVYVSVCLSTSSSTVCLCVRPSV